jgi:gas vesicle protein
MEEHEKQQSQSHVKKTQSHLIMGLFIGSAMGALAGILFAPKSGKELRSDIKEKGSKVLKDGREICSNAGTKTKEIIQEARHQMNRLVKEAERDFSDGRHQMKKILARD